MRTMTTMHLVRLTTLLAAALGLPAFAPAASAHGPDPLLPLEWVLPPGAEIVARRLEPAELGLRRDLYLTLPRAELAAVDEVFVESVVRSALEDEADDGLPVTGVIPWVATDDRGWVPLPALLPPITPPPTKPAEALAASAPTRGGRRPGFLSGKTVYVSAGHGWTWTPTLARWATQRGNTHGIVEDFVSVETINAYLVHYLEKAGATVFTVRERDFNTSMAIVDNDGGGDGAYAETGAWQADGVAGFRPGEEPYRGTTNPFGLGTTRVAPTTSGAPTAEARFTPDIPTSGMYQVYASWSVDPSKPRAPDAHFVIRHAGGEAHVRVDQRRHGGTWYPLGQWYFEAGRDDLVGAVVLMNDSSGGAGAWVSADAVRFGGGVGDAGRGTEASGPKGLTSGRPRWEENARYHSQFNGAPSSVYAYTSDERNDDVGARPRYAAWQNEVGEDAVYVAWHTNAPNPARGTVTYIYGPNPPNGNYDFTGVAGSDRLARLLHDEIIADIKSGFDPAWRDRGVKTAYFGEVNKNHNPEMPAVLVEVAFHDTEADALYLRDPDFRKTVARSYYQGIAKYFAERDRLTVKLLPEPPVRVKVLGTSRSTARVSWAPPAADAAGGDAPASYRVYRSLDGRAFDDGVAASGSLHHDLTGLEPGVPVYVRVTAVNDGGESFASPVVGVSTGCAGAAPALIVHGFYRHDEGLAPRSELSAYGLGTLIRLLPDQMNRLDAVGPHGSMIAAAGIAFDSAEATALDAGDLALGSYRLVDWVLGEESTADETLSSAEQQRLTAWMSEGKVLIISGAELGWDLVARGTPEDQLFMASLGATYVADDAETYTLIIPGGGQLQLDDGTRGMFDVNTPDVLEPLAGGSVILRYGGVGTRAAGVRRTDPVSGTDVLTFGVPLEAVGPDAARDDFVAGLLASADLERVPASGCTGVEPGPEPQPEVAPEGAGDVSGGEDAGPTGDAVAPGADAGGASSSGARRVSRFTATEVPGGCAAGGGQLPGLGLVAMGLLAWRRRRARA